MTAKWKTYSAWALLLVLLPIGVAANGWALSVLWSWFVAPVFHIAELSIPAAIGIALVVRVLTWEYGKTPQTTDEDRDVVVLIGKTVGILIGTVFAVFFGWFIHLFM